ncbi:PREDICTED: actin-binding protein anillin-like isoform X2 [Polistes dominula]|nr:PREDICTED: actin-binding protein anillin-like isoform X2 [Polistes dominula]
MLERAKARGEKLNMQLSNAGHDVRRRRSPLKDANAIIAQAAVNNNKSPAKSPIKSKNEESPKKSARKCSPQKETVEDEKEAKQIDKENGEIGISNVKSKLQRLGKLYSEDTCELSSPIHKTEEKFYAEENNQTELKSAKKGARLDRLAALASTINNWEDDLSHPVIAKTSSNKAEQIQAKFNDKVKNTTEPQPSTSGCSKWNSGNNSEGSSTKQLKWDKSVLQSLETGGGSSSSSPKKEKNISSSKLNVVLEGKVTNDDNVHKSANRTTKENANSNTPEKTVRTTNANTNNSRITSRLGFNGSPKSPISGSSPGSVLSKASMFESRNNDTKVKDPAQMSLSERKALFEKNKDEAPLIPKAPLTMSIPPSKLHEKETSNSPHGHGADPSANNRKVENSNRVVTQRAIFEHGHTQELENNILRSAQIERQKELDMLRSRFNTNKEIAQAAAGSCIRTSESSEGKSNSPKNSPICPVKPTPALPPPPPPPLPQSSNSNQKHHSEQEKSSPVKRQGNLPKVAQNVTLSDVKRIRVSPPKPGHLYPSLSDIESSTETETEYTVDSTEPITATLDENTTESESVTEAEYYIESNETQLDSEDEIEDEVEDVNTSLGRSILHEVNRKIIRNKKRSIEPDPDSTTSDISVLDEMDEYLDECLAAQDRNAKNYCQDGPTPPKLNRGDKNLGASCDSFQYTRGSLYRSPIVKPVTPEKSEQPYIVEGDQHTPLLRTVSSYRRQQSELRTPKGNLLSVSKVIESSSDSMEPSKDETILVQEKVKHLLDEVSKQQTIIGQASQALNLCSSTIEFNESQEQVEVEKLLLVATHRRQAAINEIQRLKIQGTLRPSAPGSPEIDDTGSLTISAITLPLRREYLRSIAPTTCLHFVCLVLHLDEVLATPVVVAESGDSCLRFPSTLKLQNLYSDFKVTVEIYSLRTQAEMLPHEVKYHIHNNGNGHNGNNGKDKKKTPKKCSKFDNRLVMPSVQSPAGPSAIQSSAFQLSGYIVFSLKEINRQQFTLNKVPQQSPLEGRLQMHMSCEPSITVEYRNFLTIFEYVSGFGIWQRRWMVLKGTTLSYYKYPHHEGKKTPLGSLDLRGVSTKIVDLAPFSICMRANTVLLESKRAAQPGDTDSLIMVTNGSETTIRHLYSADTKEDRLEWCSKLNKVLHILQVWGNSSGM